MSPTPTIHLSRRQCCARLLTLFGGLAAVGCATVSPQRERELGQKEAQEVERTVGLVRERRLVEYIEAIGRRLAQATGRGDIAWQWSVADESDLNAFALPGGWVYVTRGLLTLCNREDELAGVVAHEMAHVLERHAVSRVAAATPLAVLFGVPGANTPRAAGAVAPDEAAAVLLQLVGTGDDPVAGARAEGLTDAQMKGIRLRQISQLPAAALTAETRSGTRLALTWIAHRKRIFRVTGLCGSADWERYRGELERAAASFRPLRPEDQVRITESRLRIRSARAGESIAQVLARGGATWTPAQAAVANGVAIDRPLERDWPLKVAVSERYRPADGPTPGQR